MSNRIKKLPRFLRRFFQVLAKDDTFGLSAQTAYYLCLSLFPLLMLLVSLLQNGGMSPEEVLPLSLFPESVRRLILDTLSQAPTEAPVGLWGLLLSLWSGSAALWALMRGVFKAFREQDGAREPPVWGRLVAVLFLAGFLAVGALSFFLVLFSRNLVAHTPAPLGHDGGRFRAWSSLTLAGGLFLFVLALYRFTPGVRRRLRTLWPGALLAAGGWVLASFGFEFFTAHFFGLSVLLGSLGTFLCLLLWLFVVSVAVLAGAELNALLYRTDTNS